MMKTATKAACGILILYSSLGLFQARAGVVSYTDPAAFAAAAGALTTIDFEGIVSDTGISTAVSHTLSGVTFSPNSGVGSSNICGKQACIGGPFSSALYVVTDGVRLDINLPTGTVAVGGFFGDLNGPGYTANFTVLNQSLVSISSQDQFIGDFGLAGSNDFFGWRATGADTISTIRIDSFGNFFLALDDISFGAAPASVPEPASLALLGLGLAGLGFSRRRAKPRTVR